MKLFELEWFGGPAERAFRRLRPGIDDMPWGTLDAGAYAPELVDAARRSWTEGAYSEYRTAAGFVALLEAMLAVSAPIDLVGMTSGFVADEMLHVELNSRMAMELGGAAPYLVDFDEAARWQSDGPALLRVCELGVRVCCVGETFSAPLLARSTKVAAHPLTRAVLGRIVRDEAPHAQLGWQLLDWADDRLGAPERAWLAGVALDAMRGCAAQFRDLSSRVEDGTTSEGHALDHVHALGWMESSAYRAAATDALWDEVVEPLERRGIPIDRAAVAVCMGEDGSGPDVSGV